MEEKRGKATAEETPRVGVWKVLPLRRTAPQAPQPILAPRLPKTRLKLDLLKGWY
jgi:hypothetical protein